MLRFAKTFLVALFILLVSAGASRALAFQKDNLSIEARPPFHLKFSLHSFITSPQGLSPLQIQAAYNLPSGGSTKTVAIVDAYDNPNAEKDLGLFSTTFGLPSCTSTNGCFTKHKMSSFISVNRGWILEESLDVQWVHALAPNAKILLVEAKTSRLGDLLSAVSYAASQANVVAVSMSWGSNEFSGEQSYDSYFSHSGVTFFASSGDSGSGVEWPAVSTNVVGVGGTTLSLSGSSVSSETAWSGSGGGISAYVSEPSYQTPMVASSGGMRAVPDVAFDADPNTGVSVYDSYGYNFQKGWFVIGGTSVGAPSWAAISALGGSVTSNTLYADAVSNYTNFYRDITLGSNGSCGAVCTASVKYDYITGLGSPLTASF